MKSSLCMYMFLCLPITLQASLFDHPMHHNHHQLQTFASLHALSTPQFSQSFPQMHMSNPEFSNFSRSAFDQPRASRTSFITSPAAPQRQTMDSVDNSTDSSTMGQRAKNLCCNKHVQKNKCVGCCFNTSCVVCCCPCVTCVFCSYTCCNDSCSNKCVSSILEFDQDEQ